MTDLQWILPVWEEASRNGESGVLATVVKAAGSTYRRAGARLLLTSGGRRAGSVSGGCLEADLVKKAWWLTEGGKCAIRQYDTSADGELTQEFGLGCSGVIHVLVERLETALVSPLSVVPSVRMNRRPAILATVLSSTGPGGAKLGQRWVRLADSAIETDIDDHALTDFIEQQSAQVPPTAPETLTWEYGGRSAEVFIEAVVPVTRLLIFGAGDDAMPLVRMAKVMGFETAILDGRAHLAKPERFPQADRVQITQVGKPPAVDAPDYAPDEWTAVMLMSHSYAQDLAALKHLARFPLAYLGVLGPRKRTAQMLADLQLSADRFGDALHNPAGLDIGADGAEQIALAALSEIQAVINRRAGGKLRDKAGPFTSYNPQSADAGKAFRIAESCPM